VVATVNHDHHRLRCAPLSSYFSKRSVSELEPLILEHIQKLSKRLETARQVGTVLRLDAAFMALTMDFITHYSYRKAYNYLDEEHFKLSWKEAMLEASANGAMLRHSRHAGCFQKHASMAPPQARSTGSVLLEIQHMVRTQSKESLLMQTRVLSRQKPFSMP
jgi:cytochrome P450